MQVRDMVILTLGAFSLVCIIMLGFGVKVPGVTVTEVPIAAVEKPAVVAVVDIYEEIGTQIVKSTDVTGYRHHYTLTKVVDKVTGDTLLIVRSSTQSQCTVVFYPKGE